MQIFKKEYSNMRVFFSILKKKSYLIQSRDWCFSFYKAKWGPVFFYHALGIN